MSKIIVEYSTNNSGGSYWLKKADWQALQEAGWLIMDFNNATYGANGNHVPDKDGLPTVSHPAELENAHYAYKKFDTIQDALGEFESLTGQDVSEEGCNCCGAPHSFVWGRDVVVHKPVDEQDYNYASGEELLDLSKSSRFDKLKRELLERSN